MQREEPWWAVGLHIPDAVGSIPAPANGEGDTMAETLKEIILDSAANPKQATVDGVTVQQHSLRDLLALRKQLADEEAAKNPARALTRVKIIPPGAV